VSDRTTGRRRDEVELKRPQTQVGAFIDSGGLNPLSLQPTSHVYMVYWALVMGLVPRRALSTKIPKHSH